jgi:hypothetical protein
VPGIVSSRAEWKNRIGSGIDDSTATRLAAAATIEHFTSQLKAIDQAIGETIDQNADLRGRRDLLLSVIGVRETLAASLLAEMPEPGVLHRSSEMVSYAGLNASHHRSGSSPALSAMRFNPAVAALVARLKNAGRLKADCCGGNAQTPRPLLRRAEDRQAVRSSCRHASLSFGKFPIPLFDQRPIIPPSRSVAPSADARKRRSRRAAGLRAMAGLVLDRSEHAGMFSQTDRGYFSTGHATRYLPRYALRYPVAAARVEFVRYGYSMQQTAHRPFYNHATPAARFWRPPPHAAIVQQAINRAFAT